jgi:hypothetical protein
VCHFYFFRSWPRLALAVVRGATAGLNIDARQAYSIYINALRDERGRATD